MPSATPGLSDIYTPSAMLLSLLAVGNRALLSRREDPLPRALAALGYDMAAVNRVAEVKDNASLYALLREAPETFANHLLLGQLAYASPLGPGLAAVFAADDSAPAPVLAQRRAEVLAYVAHHGAWFGQLIENFLLTRYEEEDQAEVAQERAAFRASAEAAFATWRHSLGALVLPAPAPVLPPLPGPGWSLLPMRVQLDMLAMATTVLRLFPSLTHHPFATAVEALPDYHSQRLEELGEYLSTAQADERLSLSRVQGLLLYLAAHVVMLLFVSDVLDGEGLDDLLRRRSTQGPGFEELTPEAVSQLREAAAIMLSGYIDVVREHQSEAADFQALEARLAPVLAQAVG